MYSFISGKIADKNPAYIVIDNQGIGYLINITLNTFPSIAEQTEVKLYVHLAIREDAHSKCQRHRSKDRTKNNRRFARQSLKT